MTSSETIKTTDIKTNETFCNKQKKIKEMQLKYFKIQEKFKNRNEFLKYKCKLFMQIRHCYNTNGYDQILQRLMICHSK